MVKPLLFHGCFIHTVNGQLEILENRYITVENGKISRISETKPEGEYEFIQTTRTQIIVPGLVDCHVHASQYTYCGSGFDIPLLQWLNKYAFPHESKLSDTNFADRVYKTVVKRSLNVGTTTASYFASIDVKSSIVLAEACRCLGQRAFVGKVTMDCDSPDYYIEKGAEEALKNEREFLRLFGHTEKTDLVHPILTPRFVPTCSMTVMKGLAEIQRENPSLLVQTHVSENVKEIELVKSLHPTIPHYCGVYDAAGLLDHSVLAHGVHLTDDEVTLIRSKSASVVHCPSSNFNVFSGMCDVRRLLNEKVNVCLGTDVAGGSSISMIEAMRIALLCSRSIFLTKESQNIPYKPLGLGEVLCMATENGAKALGLDDQIGNFVVGKDFDALVVDMDTGATDCFGTESISDLLEKFIYTADDRNILRVYVRGKLVKRQ